MNLLYTYEDHDRWGVTKSLIVKQPNFDLTHSGDMPTSLFYNICDEKSAWDDLYNANEIFDNLLI